MKKKGAGASVRVVLADAEHKRAMITEELIDDEQIVIERVASTIEALAAMERAPADLIIANETEQRLDGVLLLQEVRQRWPTTYRVLISDNTWPDRLILAINQAGVHRIIPRQLETTNLSETIYSLVTDFLASQISTDLYDEITAVTSLEKAQSEQYVLTELSGPMLLVIRSSGPQKHLKLTQEEVFLGRDPNAGLWLPDKDISRQHARIYQQPAGTYFIEDLNSRNGTLVNQLAITSHQLRSGDIIQLGNVVKLLFQKH